MKVKTKDEEYYYLAGPMRGYENFNFAAFDAAKADLARRRIAVISPADVDRETMGFDPKGLKGSSEELQALNFCATAAIKRDIELIVDENCVGTILLPGWKASTGANVEAALTRFLKKPVLLYPDLEQAPDPTRDELVKRERGIVYGPPKHNHEGIAMIWAPLLQPWSKRIARMEPLPPHVVALLFVGLKYDRMRLRFQEDNYVDLRNYAEFAEQWQREWGESNDR